MDFRAVTRRKRIQKKFHLSRRWSLFQVTVPEPGTMFGHRRQSLRLDALGRIYAVSSAATPRRKQEGELALKERWYPIQVKQKDKAGRPDVDSFEAMMMREDCEKGF